LSRTLRVCDNGAAYNPRALLNQKKEMNDPIAQIINLLEEVNCRSKDSLVYSLWLTISMDELCKYYFHYILNTSVKNNICKHIAKRKENGEDIPTRFISKLLKEFHLSQKKKRVTLGTTIKDFKSSLTKKQLIEFFTAQILSEKILDRKRAYAVSIDIYSEEVDFQLWESWGKYYDNNCMEVLSNNTKSEKLASCFSEIWNNENIEYYIRNNVLKRVALIDFEKISFLKNSAPIAYLSACVATNKYISDDFAISVLDSVDKISTLSYVLWCLGKLGKRNLLIDLCGNIQDIENNISLKTGEPEFYA